MLSLTVVRASSLPDYGASVRIGFEKDEEVVWTLLQNGAESEIVYEDSGAYLLADTTKKKGVWRRFLHLHPSKIGLETNSTYSVQFDYEIIESPSYFQLMERGSSGWRLLLNWNGPKGYKDRAQAIFVTDAKRKCPLIFGMKGPGSIIIDNIVIRQWENEEFAQETLSVVDLKPEECQPRLADIKKNLQNSESIPEKWQISKKVSTVEKLLSEDTFTVKKRLEIYRVMSELERDIFKLKAIQDYLTVGKAPEFLTFIDNALIKIRRDTVYEYIDKPTNHAELNCAGNERESFQLVIIPLLNDVEDLRLEMSDLISSNGVIAGENITWSKVEYVNTQKKIYPVEYVGWWPDPLVPVDRISVPSLQYAQPLWITVYVPADTQKGRYTGTITIHVRGLPPQEISCAVNVRNFTLPKRATFKSAFAVRYTSGYAQRFGFPVIDNMNRMYRDSLLEHRISPQRVARVRPKLIRKDNGDYYLDFSQFSPELDHYLSKGLNSFTFGVYWGGGKKFVIHQEETGKKETLILDVLSEPYKKLMHDYFKSWAEYLEKKGCLDDVFCYIYDEPGHKEEEEMVTELIRIVHAADPRLKVMIPGLPSKGKEYSAGLLDSLDMMCPGVGGMNEELAEDMQKKGKKSWWYICMSPKHPYPNFFIDYPAIDHRVIFWMAWKYKVEGFLYWHTTYWERNPWKNSETYTSTHGDGCLFYPARKGSVEVIPTIRLANIRDGIEDYEYLAFLKRTLDRLDNSGIKIDKELRTEARRMLSVPESIVVTTSNYTKSPARLLERRNRIGNMIEQLNDRLK